MIKFFFSYEKLLGFLLNGAKELRGPKFQFFFNVFIPICRYSHSRSTMIQKNIK